MIRPQQWLPSRLIGNWLFVLRQDLGLFDAQVSNGIYLIPSVRTFLTLQRRNLTADYKKAWEDYKWRNNLFWLTWISGVPVIALVHWAPARLFPSIIEVIMTISGILWMSLFIFAGTRLGLFRCPRCRKRFGRRNGYHNTFASRCMNCGLKKYSS